MQLELSIAASFFFASLEMSPFPSSFVRLPFYLINSIVSTSYVFSFRMVFFYLVTTGWIFDISLSCENSNQSIKSMVNINNQHYGALYFK